MCSAHEAWGERFQALFTPLPPLPPPRPRRTGRASLAHGSLAHLVSPGTAQAGRHTPVGQLTAARVKLEQQDGQQATGPASFAQPGAVKGEDALMQQAEASSLRGGGGGASLGSPSDRTPTSSPDTVLLALGAQPLSGRSLAPGEKELIGADDCSRTPSRDHIDEGSEPLTVGGLPGLRKSGLCRQCRACHMGEGLLQHPVVKASEKTGRPAGLMDVGQGACQWGVRVLFRWAISARTCSLIR